MEVYALLVAYDPDSGEWKRVAIDPTTGALRMTNDVIQKLQVDVDGLLRVSLDNIKVMVPIEVQSHWGETVTLLASGSRTTSGESEDVSVERFLYGRLHLSVTAVSASEPFGSDEGLVVYVEGKDEITEDYEVLYNSKDRLGYITEPVDDWMPLRIEYKHLRVRWEISGSDASFTFGITMQGKA